MGSKHLVCLFVPLIVAGCESPVAPGRNAAGAAPPEAALVAGPPGAAGGGHYSIGTLDITFGFTAVSTPGGVSGRFHHSLLLGGELVEFHGLVTCVSVDTANRRAWIGGVITKNRSEAATFQSDRHQPGKDIWFRVLDSGEGAGAEADRTTFVGFEGDAGFDTSADYCAGQPWPDDNARTNPVTSGNIQVGR